MLFEYKRVNRTIYLMQTRSCMFLNVERCSHFEIFKRRSDVSNNVNKVS